MNSHKNARLTRLGRVHLMQQIAHLGLEAAARQVGISKRRAYIWHKRWNECGEAGLYDRSSRPASSPRQTKPDKRERVIQLRCNHRLIYTQIALRVGLSVATVGRICNQSDAVKLPPAQALPPKCRYERQTPGEILHMDMKKLARFDRPGHRVTGNFNQFSRAPGYHALHVAIDDHSRVGFSKIFRIRLFKTSSPLPWKHYVITGHGREGDRHHDRQWLGLPLKEICQIVAPVENQAPANPPLYSPHQRQSRALYPDAAAGMGLCLLLSEFRCPHPRTALLDRALQFLSPSLRYRKTTSCFTPRLQREQRCEKLHLGNL
jgi:hypothetical protein